MATKILIVEDDAQLSALVAKTLSVRGYQTRIECNGAAALLAAHEELPAVILLAVRMPILEGAETLQALRHDPRTAHIPVILLGEGLDEPTLAGAFTAGANLYLAKPPDVPTLLSAVERLATLKPGR